VETLKTGLKKAQRTFEILKWVERAVSVIAILLGLGIVSEYMQLGPRSGAPIGLICLLLIYTLVKGVLMYKKDTLKKTLYQQIDRRFSGLKSLQTEVQNLMQDLSTSEGVPAKQIPSLAGMCYELIEEWMRLVPGQEVSVNVLQYVLSQLDASRKEGLNSVAAMPLSAKLLGLNMLINVEAVELMLHNDEIGLLA